MSFTEFDYKYKEENSNFNNWTHSFMHTFVLSNSLPSAMFSPPLIFVQSFECRWYPQVYPEHSARGSSFLDNQQQLCSLFCASTNAHDSPCLHFSYWNGESQKQTKWTSAVLTNKINILQLKKANIPLGTIGLIKLSILILRFVLEGSFLFLEINQVNSSFCTV